MDRWLVAVLAVALGGALASILAAARVDAAAALGEAAILLAVVAGVAALAVPTRYTLTGTELVVRSGVLRHRIPLASIRRVYPTRNPLSSPAWSLDRLGVEYDRGRGRGLALISPAGRDEFLRVVAERARLEPRGGELRRPGE